MWGHIYWKKSWTEIRYLHWNRFLLEQLTIAQMVKKLHVLYRIQSFIITFTQIRFWSLSSARLIQTKFSEATSVTSILIICPTKPSSIKWSLPLWFSPKCYVRLSSPFARCLFCPPTPFKVNFTRFALLTKGLNQSGPTGCPRPNPTCEQL
jgi:hypothetical protein